MESVMLYSLAGGSIKSKSPLLSVKKPERQAAERIPTTPERIFRHPLEVL
jgi:hypothetical protein